MPNGHPAFWDHLPKVFASLAPLSSMPVAATFNMVYKNQSLDEVASEEATKALGGMDATDDFAYYADENAVDKAVYQLENPNALMTPWGPTLAAPEVEMVLMENPGIEPMMGLSPAEREAAAKDADDLIDNVGGWLGDFIGDVKEVAMAKGQDILQTGKDMFDTSMEMLGQTMSTTLATETIKSSMHPSNPDYENLMVSANPVEFGMYGGFEDDEWHVEPDMISTPAYAPGIMPGQTPPMSDDSWQYGPGFGFPSETGVTEIAEGDGGPSLLETLVDVFTASGDPFMGAPPAHGTVSVASDPANPDNPKHGTFVLHEELNSWLPDADEQIVWDVVEGVGEGVFTIAELQEWMGTHPELQEDRPELFSGLTWLIDMRPGAADSPLKDLGAYVEWDEIKNYTTPDQPTLAESIFGPKEEGVDSTVTNGATPSAMGPTAAQVGLETGVATGIADTEAAEAQYLPKFYQAMSKVPNANHSAVRANMDSLFYDAFVTFSIWAAPSGVQNMTPEVFAQFLDRPVMGMVEDPLDEDWDTGGAAREGYVWNPRLYTQGTEFDANIKMIKDALRDESIDPASQHLSLGANAAILAVFGGTGLPNQMNRDRLARLYSTGFDTGYISSRIHGTLRTTMDHWRKMGVEEWDIFDRMTKTPYEKAVMATPYGTDVGRPASREITPLQEPDYIDMMDPKLTGGTRGATPIAETLEPPLVTGTNIDMMNPLLTGGTREWETNPMIFPNINAAALPVSEVDPAQLAAHRAAQEAKMPWNTMPVSEAMYSEAAIELEGAPGGTVYKPYESPKVVKDISEERLRSMPTPFNEAQAERLSKGLSYQTGRWTGGPKHKWNAMSAEEKKRIMGTDEWVGGTTFVPTKA